MSSSEKKTYGRFEVLRQIGEGAMAVVYQARDPLLHRDVAIKVLHSGLIDDVEAGKRFDREARSLAQLKHPGIIKIIDVGVEDNQTYLVVEYLPNGTLKQQLGSPLPHQRAAALLVPIAQALAHAHQSGVVHRDVKPSNILLADDGAPKLADFGIVRITNSEETNNLTATGTSLGSPDYMAPEQVLGKVVDHRADIYALGVIFYEMVTGHKPFEAETPFAVMMKQANEPLPSPSRFVRNLPPVVEKVLYKACAKTPEERFQTMSEFAHLLDQLAQGKTDLKIKSPIPRKTILQKVLLSTTVLILLLLAAAGILLSLKINISGSAQPTAIAAFTAEPLASVTETTHPTATQTPIAAPTATFTHTPTATDLPSPTPSPTPFHPSLEGTVIPFSGQPINSSNAAQVIELARWGTSRIYDVAIAPNGKFTASATSTGVYINDLVTGELMQFLESEAWVYRIVVSPNSSLIAAWSEDDLLRIWDLTSGELLHTLGNISYSHLSDSCFRGHFCHPNQGPGLSFSPDGTIVGVSTRQNSLILWDFENEEVLYEIKEFQGRINSIAFSPYGDFIVTGDNTGIIQVWNRNDGSLLHNLTQVATLQ